MAMLSRVTETTDKGATETTYEIGGLPIFISLLAAVGSFGNFLVNLGLHYHWWGLT
jgi:hypothetical protein